MVVDVYQQVRQSLDGPKPAVISDWPEFVLPHTPPADPLWPAPDIRRFDPDVQETLLFRLPARQSVICALTAVEMVLPCWPSWPGINEAPDAVKQAPQRAVRTVWQWLQAGVDAEAIQGATAAIGRARQATKGALSHERSGRTRVANYFVRAVEYVLHAAFVAYVVETFGSENRRVEVYRKSDEAVYLVISMHVQAYLSGLEGIHGTLAEVLCGLDLRRTGSTDEMREQMWAPIANAFWERWWSRCRCRLAFADATSASVS